MKYIGSEAEEINDPKDCTRRKKFRKRTAFAPNKLAYLAYTAGQHAKSRRLEIANQLRNEDNVNSNDDYLFENVNSNADFLDNISQNSSGGELSPRSPINCGNSISSTPTSSFLQDDDEFIENLDVTGHSGGEEEEGESSPVFIFDIKGINSLNLGINIPNGAEDLITNKAILKKDYHFVHFLQNLKKRRHKEWFRAFRDFTNSKQSQKQEEENSSLVLASDSVMEERIDNLIKMFSRQFSIKKR